MAGWRIGMLCGAEELIDEVLRFKSNMDSGMFLPVQLAAAKALALGREWYNRVNEVYHQRREKVFELLDLLQCSYSKKQAGMFVWAAIPPNYNDGYELSDYVLYKSNVFITPGGIFGSAGNNYIRVSLCCKEENIRGSNKQDQQYLKYDYNNCGRWFNWRFFGIGLKELGIAKHVIGVDHESANLSKALELNVIDEALPLEDAVKKAAYNLYSHTCRRNC